MKTQKNYVLDLFRHLFTRFKKNKSFFWKTCFCHFSLCLDFYCWGFTAELQKKKNEQIPIKIAYRCTVRKTDKSTDKNEVIGPLFLSLCASVRDQKNKE